MNWKLMDDPDNVENGNAGNGGDLVKHTVYLATLRFLLRQPPWHQTLRLRECHAGRGVYYIPNEKSTRKMLSRLYSAPVKPESILLYNAQREILDSLGYWSDARERVQWYAGSALINAFALGADKPSEHEVDAYEGQAATRGILRTILKDRQLYTPEMTRVLPLVEHNADFDGEAYIREHIADWHRQDVILLDPFAIWRQPADQLKRDHYRAFVDGLIRRKADAPSFILFWTWGRAFQAADGDLDGTSKNVANGYQDLRSALHGAGRRIVLVKWRWRLQFAMWVLVPREQVGPLREEINVHCRMLTDHLTRNGYRPTDPRVHVTID